MATRPSSTKKAPTAVRSRKPLQTLPTNINLYDRTDPFAAFNSLRKLLSFLPSRVGGCQYKLTSEEHKLSMDLLAIVEPFIGISPARRTISRQPTEILDHIVFFVDSKRDLLSLGLTCHRMHSVVFPRHFDYRIIRAKVSSIRVWNHLVVHRAFARNVRRLEILDERDASANEVIPHGIVTTDTDVESTDDELGIHVKQEKLLIAALNKTSALKSFKWSCNHSLVSIDNIWPVLVKCKYLHQVEINDNTMFVPIEDSEEESNKKNKVSILPDLTSISFKSTKAAYGVAKNPKLARLSGMLNHCPNLENLQIGYNQRRSAGHFQPSADDFLLCGRWAHLSSLTLTSLWCSNQGLDSLATFLSSHGNLESLSLDISVGGGNNAISNLVLPPNSLPRLRELKSNKEVANAIMSCEADQPRPLEVIKGVKLSGLEWDRTFLMNLNRLGSKVARIELSSWNELDDIKRLVDCAPKLTWLDVGKRESTATHKTMPFAHNVTEWTNLLVLLPELTTFHGIKFFYEVPSGPLCVSDRSKVRKNEETASVLAWKCPKLRRLDHWEEGKVIVLLRDGDKAKHEVRRIKADTKG